MNSVAPGAQLIAAELAREALLERFNRLVPPCSVDIKWEKDCVKYLHPTKGYKRVSFRRLGIVR